MLATIGVHSFQAVQSETLVASYPRRRRAFESLSPRAAVLCGTLRPPRLDAPKLVLTLLAEPLAHEDALREPSVLEMLLDARDAP